MSKWFLVYAHTLLGIVNLVSSQIGKHKVHCILKLHVVSIIDKLHLYCTFYIHVVHAESSSKIQSSNFFIEIMHRKSTVLQSEIR